MASKKLKIEMPREIPTLQRQSGPWKSLEELYRDRPPVRKSPSLRTKPIKIKRLKASPVPKKEVKVSRSPSPPKTLDISEIDEPFEEELSESDISIVELSSAFDESRVAVPMAKTEVHLPHKKNQLPEWDDIPLMDSRILIELPDEEPSQYIASPNSNKSDIKRLLVDFRNLFDVLIIRLDNFMDKLGSVVVKKGK